MELSKILYVEDDPDIQTVAVMALEMIGGLTLEVCSSGEEAIAKGDEFKPELILLDVMMPEMDGPTTLGNLRKISSLSDVPAVFMTAKATPADVQNYKDMGAVDVIPKPFDPMTLAEQVRKIWNKSNG